MFLGIVATPKKEIYRIKSSERTIHFCDRNNKLTTSIIPNASTLTFGNLVILDDSESYNYKNLLELEQNQFNQDILFQLYELLEKEKEMLSVDAEVFKKNFGDFGKIGEEIFTSFSSRAKLIKILNDKFCEVSLNVKCNQKTVKEYVKVKCLKIIGEMQFSNVSLSCWLRAATSALHFSSNEIDSDEVDKNLLIKTIESLLNAYVDDLDKDELKSQLEQKLREELNELRGKQKKLV